MGFGVWDVGCGRGVFCTIFTHRLHPHTHTTIQELAATRATLAEARAETKALKLQDAEAATATALAEQVGQS